MDGWMDKQNLLLNPLMKSAGGKGACGYIKNMGLGVKTEYI